MCAVIALSAFLCTPGQVLSDAVQTISPYVVYENSQDPIETYYSPGAGDFTSDDLQLTVAGTCSMDSYSLLVYAYGGGPFNVDVELWSSDPCGATSSLITGTAITFSNVMPSVDTPRLLTAMFDPPILIPSLLYMRARFSTNQAGWIIANQAETGYTMDQFWLEEPQFHRCNYYWWSDIGEAYAGFWARITCGVLGDFNGNRHLDTGDIPGFASALLGLNPADAGRADINHDGHVNGLDIEHFIDALTSP